MKYYIICNTLLEKRLEIKLQGITKTLQVKT